MQDGQRIIADNLRMKSLYAIAIPETAIKFGIASRPTRRLQALQVGCPASLVLLAEMYTDALWIEQAIHTYLAPEAIRGEWFRMCPRTLGIVDLLRRDDELRLARLVVEGGYERRVLKSRDA